MGKKRIISKGSAAPAEDETKGAAKTATTGGGKRFEKGCAYISATYNNTIISLTNEDGDVLASASSGAVGFKGSKKATPYAASKVGEAVLMKLKKITLGEVTVYLRGVGSGRDSAIRSLAQSLNIVAIKDITPIPHNGPRQPKVRRI